MEGVEGSSPSRSTLRGIPFTSSEGRVWASSRRPLARDSLLVLSQQQIDRFDRDGFLALDRPFVSTDDLEVARRLIDGLFERFDELPSDLAYDLGDVQLHDGPQQLPEINDVLRLEPRLLTTAAFARCRDLAAELLGNKVKCSFSHAINKPSHTGAAREWHQDLADAPHLAGVDAVHIWFALQDVNEANGCMRFIPDDEHSRLLPHRQRGGSSLAHALVADGVDRTRAIACPLQGGMATVHRPMTLHSTGPNTTHEPRLAWIMHFHREAPRPLSVKARRSLSRIKRSLHA